MKFTDRLSHAWNAFKGNEYKFTTPQNGYYNQYATSVRPDRTKYTMGNGDTIIAAIYTRMAIDCANINVEHARVDENDNYVETIKSGLNNALRIEANKDQTGKALIQDIVMSMFDEGVVAVVPVETDISPVVNGGYDVTKLRTAKVIEWYPDDVKVRIYNEDTGKKVDKIFPKKMVALVENPFYSVMNEKNSVLKKLVLVLHKLDIVNDQNASGKLDLIIQLPYLVHSPKRKEQAELRRKEVESQLTGSKYGVAYTDGTEKITQLNRAVENNLMSQVEYYTNMLYSQLGISKEVFDGTASEEQITNYYDRTINPIMSAICDEFCRKFLTKTARTQKQRIWFFKDPFELVPITKLAEVANSMIMNEVLTKNEVRGIIGFKPSDDPVADTLHNPQLYPEDDVPMDDQNELASAEEVSDLQQQIDDFDEYDAQLDELEGQLSHSAIDILDEYFSDDDEDTNSLAHYASKYYDPVKAHEYYERTKKLKGRSSLSDKGKEVADYVTKQLNAERDRKISTSKTNTSNSLSKAKSQHQARVSSSQNIRDANIAAKKSATQKGIDNHNTQMQNQISQLQDELREWGASGKAGKTKEIRNKIARLREKNNEAKEKLQNELSSYSESERNSHSERSASSSSQYNTEASGIKTAGSNEVSNIREEYNNKLASEMDRIMKEYPEDEAGEDGGIAELVRKRHEKAKMKGNNFITKVTKKKGKKQ